MKLDLSKVSLVFAVIIPLWGGIVFLWTFEKSLAKKTDIPDISVLVTKTAKAVSDLDGIIANTIILTTIYELHGLTELDELERIKYDRANTQLVSLKAQRNRLLGVSSD